jgi:hypothetical protein
VEQQHVDAALAHHVDERVVLLTRATYPDDVVEEQLVAVRGRQPLVARSGRCTITLRSVPTSEATPRSGVVEGVATSDSSRS